MTEEQYDGPPRDGDVIEIEAAGQSLEGVLLRRVVTCRCLVGEAFGVVIFRVGDSSCAVHGGLVVPDVVRLALRPQGDIQDLRVASVRDSAGKVWWRDGIDTWVSRDSDGLALSLVTSSVVGYGAVADSLFV